MPALCDIFGIWETQADMARDLSLPYHKVTKWAQRRRIPSPYWPGIVAAAKSKRGRTLTLEQLAAANAQRRSASVA